MNLIDLLFPKTKKAISNLPQSSKQKISLQELGASSLGPLGEYLLGSERQKERAKSGAELASYAVPFGKGNLLNKFLLPGAVSGALRASSEDNPTLQSIGSSAAGGAIGSGVAGGAFNLLGKTGSALTKKIPEGIMNRIFKEGMKQTKSAIKGGQTLGQEALKRGVKGGEDQIFQTAISKIDDLENSVQSILSKSKSTIGIDDLLKTVQPLIDKYKKAGNDTAAKSLENRIMSIWQNSGENIPVSAANDIKRTLYQEVGNAYGQVGSEGVEGLKSVARGIKKAVAKKVPLINKLNEELGFWGRARDSMVDKLARGGRNQFPGLRDTILAAGGIAGAPATGGASLLPFLASAGSQTGVKTGLANILNKGGQAVSNFPIPQSLAQVLGTGGAQVGSRVAQSIPVANPSLVNNDYSNQNNSQLPHDQSIQQPVNMSSQGAKDILSEDGQWKWDQQKNDWVPNQEAQTGEDSTGGFTREQIGQAMLLDLAKTGGKNLSELKTLSEFLIPEESKKKPLTAVQQQLATNVDSANRSIDKVEDILNKDPDIILKASIPGVGGRLAGASTYNTARKEIADVIARMRTGAVINDVEMENYLSKLPQIGDSSEDIKYKMGELRFIFQSLKERLENQSGPDININQLTQ